MRIGESDGHLSGLGGSLQPANVRHDLFYELPNALPRLEPIVLQIEEYGRKVFTGRSENFVRSSALFPVARPRSGSSAAAKS